jgi:hypothetical protein
MRTYLIFDSSMTLQGSPGEITKALWDNCKAHEGIGDIHAFMAWQKETERRYSGRNLDISSFETFIASLVEVGFLIPIN